MTSVNSLSSSTSSTKTSGYTAKGFTGLASGMDTEEVVAAMTSDIQAKIDKVKQEQQKYTWKQEAYRTVISSLTSFQDKFFSYSSPSTNLLSTAIYNCSKKVSQGANASKISVTSSSNSSDAAYKITSVKALATKTRGVGNCSIGGNTISTGNISFADRTTNVVAGKEFNITYDNVKYTLTIPDSGNVSPENQGLTTSTLLNEALRMVKVEGSSTTSLADKLSFTTSGDKLELKSTYSGDSRSFTITGADSTTLSALGFTEGQSGSASNPIVAANPINVLQTGPFSVEGKKLTFNLDGLSKTISFTKDESKAIMDAGNPGDDNDARRVKMAQTIKDKLSDSFGAGKVSATAYKVDKNGNFLDASGNIVADEAAAALDTKLNFVVKDSTSILKITSPTLDTIGTNSIFGMEGGITNRLDNSKTLAQLAKLAPSGIAPTTDDADPNKKLYKITVNGKDFEFKGSDQLSTVLSKINNDEDAGVTINYLNTTNKFDITSDEYGKLGKVAISDGVGGNLAATLFGNIAANTKPGTDLEMTIRYDGDTTDTIITRNSNTVSLDGIKFNVEGTFESTTEAVSFKTETNTDDTIKVIKQMAEEYNKILDSVNSLVTTKSRTNKRNQATYEPLTDAQKAKMTSSEIEKWEEKAQKGILFGDSTLSQLASTLRFAFSSMVGDMGFAKDIGITAASSYSGNGKITINETKLKEALTNDPEKVKAMFTASAEEAPNLAQPTLSGGFATRVKTVMETYAKSTGAYKGKLVQLAGLQNNATTNDNYIERQQKILSNKLESLETLLKNRQDRYQSQFTKLETYISKMNSQSSWLSSATSA